MKYFSTFFECSKLCKHVGFVLCNAQLQVSAVSQSDPVIIAGH